MKDIPNNKVENLAIAISPKENAATNDLWDVFVLNLEEEPIKNVLINSKGYGTVNDEEKTTTVLRHFFEEIGPLQFALIEPIQPELFHLTNEYWVSFSFNGYMYDKKYVFVKGSISEMNFTTIPFVNRKGVMIR